MKLSSEQKSVMSSEGHLLVTGGPGSGKTTISIIKAAKLLGQCCDSHQKVLFLSFARASVSRVIEAIEYESNISKDEKSRIVVDTYHSFFWNILKTHGYLIGLPRKIDVLSPQLKSIRLSEIRSRYPVAAKISDEERKEKKNSESIELKRLMFEEGLIDFDSFAEEVLKLLKSDRIKDLLSNKYPVIILDEFQDTNDKQWLAIKEVGKCSTIIALADPEQRIYDWIGADPERLKQFVDFFDPTEIDFGQQNHRSSGTEISVFANHMLSGKFNQNSYLGVRVKAYLPNQSQAYTTLVNSLLTSIKRAKENNPNKWSVAILVPTKKMTRKVSEVLSSPPGTLPKIYHEPYIDFTAAILSAEIISFLLEPQDDNACFPYLIKLVADYFRGKGGDKPSITNLNQANKLESDFSLYVENNKAGKKMKRNSVMFKLKETYEKIVRLNYSGNPEEDWKAVAKILENSNCKLFNSISDDAKNIRLLRRGEKIRQDFGLIWRENGCYKGALSIVRSAFMQLHFSTKSKPEQGVVIMNMHKAKGKQFDEVIIFEDWPKKVKGKIVSNSGRIVKYNLTSKVTDQDKQNFRVSITRAKYNTVILTPGNDQCVLLP